MNRLEPSVDLSKEPDFDLGYLRVCPSACSVAVDRNELRIEAQAMSALIVLVRADGATVSRTQLIDACWGGRTVTDDAITRTIAKVRALARLSSPPAFDLTTVPKIGYRLTPASTATNSIPPSAQRHWLLSPLVAAWGCIALIAALAGAANTILPALPSRQVLWASALTPSVQSTDAVDALLNTDDVRLHQYIRQGWNPNWHIDSESNAALHTLMLACERNPTHDQAAVVRVARMLVDAGADPAAENGWGDTPLEIAMSPRYCGPDHPVVAYLRERSAQHSPVHTGAER